MAERILVDVDTQFDFVDPQGALHVPAAAEVRARIEVELRRAVASGDPIVGSVDSHAWDAWEFSGNGGPFAPHCVKGTAGWLRVLAEVPPRTRFIPMQPVGAAGVQNLVGECAAGQGARTLDAAALAAEAIAGVGLYFEKEVYALFSNPVADPVLEALVAELGGRESVFVDVLGFCTGGYCVDAAVEGLLARGYRVRVLGAATAAIGGAEGHARSERALTQRGAQWLSA